MMEEVILVNDKDEQIGTMEKLEAHEKGVLHRAFSVFLFDVDGRMLMQRRADSKYHSAGLWSNTCCSHPQPGESLESAVDRRLWEELGVKATTREVFSFIYEADLENNLIEHELDHVFIGKITSVPQINPEEVSQISFMTEEELSESIEADPSLFTVWFLKTVDRVWETYELENNNDD